MPNALFKRFNGTTFEEFKFEAFDSEKLGGVLPSGYALVSHEHTAADITSGTINIARIPLTNIAGNTNTSF